MESIRAVLISKATNNRLLLTMQEQSIINRLEQLVLFS